MCVCVCINSSQEVVIGSVGVVHPDVLSNFEVTYPCCVMELNLEAIM